MPDLHIVTFAVPYPPDYGGAIEVWNRLTALHAEGVRIHLHCFEYGRYTQQEELRKYATEVSYYPRALWSGLFTRRQPLGVASRKAGALLKALKKDKSPILFETPQTTAWLEDLVDRTLLLRAHNIEHFYYGQLAGAAKGVYRIIYARESGCLEDYEKEIAPRFDAIFSIGKKEHDWFLTQHGKSEWMPAFRGRWEAEGRMGRGKHILYQGDLSIETNQEAVFELISLLPDKMSLPLIIAGRKGNPEFESKIKSRPNIIREADVSNLRMEQLIRDAHLVLLHSRNADGVKMKIFPALQFGRFVFSNAATATHSSLDDAFVSYDTNTLPSLLGEYITMDFTRAHIDQRQDILLSLPGDSDYAKRIVRYL